ncbi:MAG TPA: class I SAM-dependent methyltransferase [Methylomirabilota bacterium]|nr:class I SAM-dependent methyltransferase [Methylomirabilota bacterium]
MTVARRVAGGAGRLQEDADLETSSEAYTRRFAGDVGRWFLELQTRSMRELLGELPRGSSILDVGGGHGQIAPALVGAGHTVTILGSSQACAAHLESRMGGAAFRFEVGDLRALPFPDRAFTVVTCFRLLPHSVDWRHLMGELCRVAELAVVADYPSRRSVNQFANRFFSFKRRAERNTRPFELFDPGEIEQELGHHGFEVRAERPQFLLPMVLYRMAGSDRLGRLAEQPGRWLGLTRYFGSPVITRADRRRSA